MATAFSQSNSGFFPAPCFQPARGMASNCATPFFLLSKRRFAFDSIRLPRLTPVSHCYSVYRSLLRDPLCDDLDVLVAPAALRLRISTGFTHHEVPPTSCWIAELLLRSLSMSFFAFKSPIIVRFLGPASPQVGPQSSLFFLKIIAYASLPASRVIIPFLSQFSCFCRPFAIAR